MRGGRRSAEEQQQQRRGEHLRSVRRGKQSAPSSRSSGLEGHQESDAVEWTSPTTARPPLLPARSSPPPPLDCLHRQRRARCPVSHSRRTKQRSAEREVPRASLEPKDSAGRRVLMANRPWFGPHGTRKRPTAQMRSHPEIQTSLRSSRTFGHAHLTSITCPATPFY